MPLRRLLAAVALTAAVTAQNRPIFRADVSEVRVDAEVLNTDGRIITGLSKGDFRVFDEGHEQLLVGFAAEEQPLDMILLFDISSSMRSKVQKVVLAAREALHELKQGDRVSVMTFSDQTHVVSSFTMDLDSAERDILGIVDARFSGLTYMQQALDDAANCFLRDARTRRRRAILVITDNLGIRTRKEMAVVRNLWEADALVCGLTIRDPGFPVRRAIVAIVAPYALAKVGGMDRIAEMTGGDVVRTEIPGRGFSEMMRRIRSRYSLYYATPGGQPGSLRTVRVELSAGARKRFPGARVLARKGYQVSQR